MRGRKRRSSWGSIDSVSPDKHVIRYMEASPGGRRRRSKTFYGSRKGAELELARLRVLNDVEGAPPVTFSVAWATWVEPWIEKSVAAGKLSRNTERMYRSSWKPCEERWGGTAVGAPKPMEVQAWLDPMSKEQARSALRMMRKAAGFAAKFAGADAQWAGVDYDLPAGAVRERKSGTYTWDEADALWLEVRGTPLEGAFLASMFGGLRVGEALAMSAQRLARVEVRGFRFCAVGVACQKGNRDGEVTGEGELKNPQSVRTALVPGRYGDALLALGGASGSGWLSDRGEGIPMGHGSARAMWGRKRLPMQNLRPSWRTMAAYDWGLPDHVLEPLMGHKMQGVTGKHYLRPDTAQIAELFLNSLDEKARLRIF